MREVLCKPPPQQHTNTHSVHDHRHTEHMMAEWLRHYMGMCKSEGLSSQPGWSHNIRRSVNSHHHVID